VGLAFTYVTKLRQTEHAADIDSLTGALNKRCLQQRLGDWIHYAERESQPLSLLLLDIDHFKNYNDTNGHLAGDKLLQELASLVSESVRKDDIFGRFGGEEFLLILPHTNTSQALAAAEKIRSRLAAHPFAFAERQPLQVISISGGVAEYPMHGLDAAALLHAADEALYQAKRTGRNRVLPADADTPTPRVLPPAPAGAPAPVRR
jgi:diguanylate cyclase (GGDEF)-like protein